MTTNIPYTTAKSDFLKFVEFKDDSKSDLIDYAATDFLSLRESLISYIKAVYPLDYETFSESDLGMMFIELISYMGAVMSMKTDMIAHEMFLKTAKNPNNLRKLFDIVGVRFRGPTSAAAMLTATLEDALEGTGTSMSIAANNRVILATSPIDGSPVSYTLYSSNNGNIEGPTSNSDLIIRKSESVDGSGLTWNNLVLVEGSFSVDEGTFTDVDVLKEIPISNFPVIDGSVQVFIEALDSNASGVYTEVGSLLSTSSSDLKVFQVVYGDDFSAKVQFGDGVISVLPPPNSSYVITYRIGGGQRGNAPTNFINTSITSSDEVSPKELQITNRLPFTGGTEAETVGHATKYGKLVFRQQDRIVSLEDYIAFANTYRGPLGTAIKASASTRKAYSSANVIDLYVLEKASSNQLQKASIALKEALISDIQSKKMLTDEVVIVDGLIRTLDLSINVTIDRRFEPQEGVIKTKISKIISDYFNTDNREFGETFFPDSISREIFTKVADVRIAEVTNFTAPVDLEFNEILQLNNFFLTFYYV
tara:strand:- start:2543 stop:4147 length:1605 start_codon:yes stop_codon:yes gene_type:complete